MIYDAMDALRTNNPDKNKTDLLSMIDRIEGKVTAMIDLADKMTAAIQTRDKEIARLLRALQAKDEKIEKLTNYGNVYRGEMDKYFHALRLAVEDMETIKPKGKMCVMAVIDEETAARCSGQGDCDDCLFWFYTKRAMAHIEMIKSAVRDEIEDRKRMDVEDQRGEFAKCNDLAEQIIEKGKELEEKMRR